MKEWIDNASYEELLRKWRFAPTGDPLFAGEMGDYFMRKMDAKRKELTVEEYVEIHKKVGWEKA